MSEIAGSVRRRRRRADAERSITAILDAAVDVLNERPGASIGDVAEAAGVTRQTVYAHYPSREALLTAAIDHVSAAAVVAMDAALGEDDPPTQTLLRLANIGWRTYERYPQLLRMSPQNPDAERTRHAPVRERFERVIRDGQDTGDFDQQLSPAWLATVAMTLGHAAANDIAAGRMPASQATSAIEHSILRIVAAGEPRPQPGRDRRRG